MNGPAFLESDDMAKDTKINDALKHVGNVHIEKMSSHILKDMLGEYGWVLLVSTFLIAP